MTGIFYLGQEDVDFESFGSPTSFTPTPIANDGSFARAESSPNVIGCYSPIDRQALVSNIGAYNSSFNGGTINDLWFSCQYYGTGDTGSGGGSVYLDYVLKFDNFAFSNFSTYSIIINTGGNVSLTDGSTFNNLLTNTIGGAPITWVSGTLTKLDVHIVYGTSGTIDVYSAGTHVYNYSGDLTSGQGPGSGFYNINYGSVGGTGTGTITYFSEIIVSDTTDSRPYYMSSTLVDGGNTAYTALVCDYSTAVVSSSDFDYNFNYPFSVEIPSYYVSGDVIYCGQSSIGAFFNPGFGSPTEQWITWFSITNSGGTDTTYSYSAYDTGNPVATTTACMPRTTSSLTGLNILTAAQGDIYPSITTGPAPGTFSICKLTVHVAFGSGTANPCISAPVYTNVMFTT